MNSITSYTLNTDGAKAVGSSTFITEKGAYKGTFTRAEAVTSKRGTQGIEFDFKSDSGQVAQYLTVWTVNAEGNELFGRKIVDALLTCMEVRSVNASQGRVTRWDAIAKKEVQEAATVFADLMHKPIGILISREEYENNNGERKWKNNLSIPFEAASNKTAREKLLREPAAALINLVEALRDKPMAEGGFGRTPTRQSTSTPARQSTAPTFEEMDSDIPF